jgi:hypothetical protein
MAHPKTTSCDHCSAVIDLDGRVGRPPLYCSAECRRAGYAASERARRERRKREIARLRELVSIYETALAA